MKGTPPLAKPEQLNVLADHLATDALTDLCAAGKPSELYPLPTCRVFLRDATGYLTSNEKRTLRTEVLSTNSGSTPKNVTIDSPRL
jgi:hypothetical protein